MSMHDTQDNHNTQPLKKTILFITGAVIVIAVLLVASYLVAGGGQDADHAETPIDLDGSAWVLLSLSSQEPIPGTEVTGEFIEGNFSGTAGCNNYFTSYETAGDSLRFGPAGSTMMFCELPEGVMDQEIAYLSSLAQVSSYQIDLEELLMFDDAGNSILVFKSTH